MHEPEDQRAPVTDFRFADLRVSPDEIVDVAVIIPIPRSIDEMWEVVGYRVPDLNEPFLDSLTGHVESISDFSIVGMLMRLDLAPKPKCKYLIMRKRGV